MRNFYLVLVSFLLWGSVGFAQCENIYLSSQAQVDNYPVEQGCSSVTGNFYISGTDITNLNGLSGITSVQNLYLTEVPNLINYSGLNNLTTVVGNLGISYNSATTIPTFPLLTSIGGTLSITQNNNLSQLPAFNNLTAIGGLDIALNPALQNLNGLANLTSINGGISIHENQALTSIASLNGINTNSISQWHVWANWQLSTCNISNLCSYLANGGNAYIENATGCNNVIEVLAACYPGCAIGDVTLNSQAQVDAFSINHPSCTLISGSLTIYGGDITNLNGLSNITKVLGNVTIYNNPQLTSLSGLNNLASVFGSVQVNYNDQLTNLSGLGQLSKIKGNLDISYNTSITTLTGLNALTSANYLSVYNNPALVNLTGLNALTTVINAVSITSNNSLNSLSGLNNLATVASLTINANPSLTSLTALTQLQPTIGSISISDNNALTSIAGLSNLTSIGSLLISGNSSLLNLTGLNNLVSAGTLHINNNNALQSLTGLGNLVSVNLNMISYYYALSITNNAGLLNLNGLNSLTSAAILNISNNALLNNITALSNLTNVNYLTISQNPQLVSLSGLNNISTAGLYDLTIASSANLSTCNLPNICTFLSNGGSSNISGNATGCDSSLEVQIACNNGNQCPVGNFVFSKQSQIDAFIVTYPTCTTINGTVTITGNDITNLAGLSNIVTFNQGLTIQSNPLLTSLIGLSSLTTVNGHLIIESNPVLVNLTGLNALATVTSTLRIKSNPLLTSLSGLNNLNTIGGEGLIIDDNASLVSIAALQGLTTLIQSFGSYFNYYYNTGISINSNPALVSLNGLQNLTGTGYFSIKNNASLSSLTTFSCANIGPLEITNNPLLTTLNGLESVTSVANLVITNNASLTSLQGLQGLTTFDGYGFYYAYFYLRIYIANNAALTGLTGIENINLSTIIGLLIYDSPNLSYCNTSNVCSYLATNPGNINNYIGNNAAGCANVNEVRFACGENDPPTFGAISPTEITICSGSYQTITLSGLFPTSISRINYTIGSDSATVDVNSDASGNGTWNLYLYTIQDGQTLTITAVERIDLPTGSIPVSINNIALLHVNPSLTVYYTDADGDGYGSGYYPYYGFIVECSAVAPTGYSANNYDCDDANPLTYQQLYAYVDSDSDGYTAGQTWVCSGTSLPTGYSETTNGNDCNDSDAAIYTTYLFYADTDLDGFGAGNLVPACALNATTVPTGYSLNNTDCSPDYAAFNSINSFYYDEDGDGYGSGSLIPLCSLNATTPPLGYSVNNTDCSPNNPLVYTGYSFYADADGDGYGAGDLATVCAQNETTVPAGYSLSNNDCSPGNSSEFPGQIWYTDADRDRYGTGNYITQCSRPVNGYLESELISINGDCNDYSATISPVSQRLEFSGTTNFTTAVCSPLNGTLYTNFTFEVIYFDANNSLPPATFPRVYLDYEGNGYFNDGQDRAVIMTPSDVNDLNTVDGKKYIGTINGLNYGTSYQTTIQVGYGACLANFGPFNYPDVQIEPNLQFFANDITFSTNHPAVAAPLMVNTVVHNESDFPALNFYVHLVNQFDTSIVYGDILVPYLAPHSTTTVSWNITTPAIPAWCPMQVIIDYTDVISESNELDNSAIRPFINGNYNLLGGIDVINEIVSPEVSYIINTDDRIYISGGAIYFGTPTPLLDPSVAGATVTYTVVETGATYSTYTNSQGNFSSSFPAPMVPRVYHIQGELTDYTFSQSFNLTFTRLPYIYCPTDLSPNVSVIANTALVVDGGVPPYTIVQGESFSGNITVYNNCEPVNVSTLLSVNQSGGTPIISDATVPPLVSNSSYTIPFNNIVFNTPGSYAICATADTNNAVEENWENNTHCQYLNVLPNLPDIYPYNGTNGNSLLCNTNSVGFTLGNAGGAPTGQFNCDIIVRKDDVIIDTLHQTVANINALSYYSFSNPFNFPSTGDYTFELQCDIPMPNGIVTEVSELNNTAIFNLHLDECVYKPELYLAGCESFDVQPVDPQNPGTLTFVATLVNGGNATATGPISVRFHLSGGQNYDTQYNGNLAPGQSAEITVNAPSVASATQTLTAIADYANQIEEYSENNNEIIGSLCWDFEPVDRPYWCKSSLDDFWDHTQIVNKPVYLNVGVNQYHLYDASTVLVKFEISGPGLTGTVNLGNATMNNVEQNCNCPYTAALPYSFVFPQEGDYIVTMTVDPNNVYTECSEGNNVLVRTVHVSNLPDLRVLSQFINPSLLNPDPGTPVTLNVTYENIGTTNLEDTTIELKVLVDEVPLSTVYVGGLGTSENNTVSIPITWSSNVVGAHIIRTVIDSNNQVVEGNEMNNEATRAIVVGAAANLRFNLFAVSNSSPTFNSQIMINATIANQGDLNCEGDVVFYYLNDQQQEVQIGMIHVNVNNNSSTTIELPWTVLDSSTTILARIINASVLEFTYDDNEATTTIGGMSISFTSTPSCAGLSNGTLTAVASGGQAPYSYQWSTGFNNSILNAGAGTYSITVTDNTGQSVTGTGTILTGGSGIAYYADADNDSYGNPNAILMACSPPLGYVANNTDCNDTKAAVHPGATEIFDGIDNDCDSLIDEGTTLGAPVVQNTSRCKVTVGVAPTATALPDYSLVWYSSATSSTALTATPLITSSTKTYWVAQRLGAGPISPRAQVITTVNQLPSTPGTMTTTDAVLCKHIGTLNTVTYTVPIPVAPAVAVASYSWSLPDGVNPIGATNTNSITVNFLGASSSTLTGGVGTITARAVSAASCSSLPRSLVLTSKLPTAPTSLTLTSADTAEHFSAKIPLSDPVAYNTSLSDLTKITKVGPYMGTTTVFTLTSPIAPTAASYAWTLPDGVNPSGSVTGNVITVNFAGVPSGIGSLPIVVKSVGGCGQSAARTLTLARAVPTAPTALVLTDEAISSLAITKVSAYTGKSTPLTLTAIPVLVQGATATSYAWILPTGVNCITPNTPTIVKQSVNTGTFTPEGAPIFEIRDFAAISTGTASTITVNFADVASGTLSFPLAVFAVNGTGNSKARIRTVTAAAPTSPAITAVGGTTFNSCNSKTYTVVQTPGTSYTWTVPANATYVQTGNVIVVDYTNVAASVGTTVQVSCVASNGTGSSLPKVLNVKRVACPVRLLNPSASAFSVKAYPNPSSSEFTIETSAKGAMSVKVYDMTGRLVEKADTNKVGSRLASGVYNVIVNQGTKVKTVRVIKK